MHDVKVGSKIPDVLLKYIAYTPEISSITSCGRPIDLKTHEFLSGKKAVIFAIPGPFTSTCTEAHVPGFLANYDNFIARGVDVIICTSVADAYVMSAFGKAVGVEDKIIMVGDGNGEWTKALGLTIDLSHAHMGQLRSKRYALIVDDLKVTYVGVETAPGLTVSGADAVLAEL